MNQLVPEIPVLAEYDKVKQQILTMINSVNEFEIITSDNEKEVKKSIAEINKIKDRISRYRIDNTNAFMANIQNYINQCKELETLCSTGISDIKKKISELEEIQKQNKIDLIKKMYELQIEQHAIAKDYLCFDLFYEKSMSNKSTSLNVIEAQLKTWITNKENDLNFIIKNCDEPQIVITNYKNNGLNLASAIAEYQERFKNEAEIKAKIAENSQQAQESFEKVLDICIKIHKLPKSKVQALQSFLDSLKVDFTVEKL